MQRHKVGQYPKPLNIRAELASASLTKRRNRFHKEESITMTEPVLGIDIAKLKFNVCLINLNGKLKHKVFPNTATGICLSNYMGPIIC